MFPLTSSKSLFQAWNESMHLPFKLTTSWGLTLRTSRTVPPLQSTALLEWVCSLLTPTRMATHWALRTTPAQQVCYTLFCLSLRVPVLTCSVEPKNITFIAKAEVSQKAIGHGVLLLKLCILKTSCTSAVQLWTWIDVWSQSSCQV